MHPYLFPIHTSIRFVHNRTWCCNFLRNVQFSVSASTRVLLLTSLSHLILPSILGIFFQFCHIYVFHINLALYYLSHSLPRTIFRIYICPLNRNLTGRESVPTVQFVSNKSPSRSAVLSLCPPRGRVVVVCSKMCL